MWFNGIMTWLLSSPFHFIVSNSIMLIRFRGRKSGKPYMVPVNYVTINNQGGDELIITSYRHRTWWRNLRGGIPLTISLRGKNMPAKANVIEDDEGVIANLQKIFGQSPKLARYMGVTIPPDGKISDPEIKKAASSRVIILISREGTNPS
jgi:deazaflavin-dependent oxidoreductase (nitroreductase family)